MAVPITVAGASIELGPAHRALKGVFRGGPSGILVGSLRMPDYDVTRDGLHFLMYAPDAKTTGRAEHVTFVLNWFTDLRRLLATRN